MNTKEWLAKLLSLIYDIADEDFQQRVWVEGKGPEVSCFDEHMCMIFDDFRLPEFIAECREKGLYPDKIDELDRFRKALDKFIDKTKCDENPLTIMNDIEWAEIRGMAMDVLRSFEFDLKTRVQV